ncbi:DNA polymerase nu-like [Mizuhopecten yessoensis]|uniref:DNA polymerase nu n=1 Tax=Mizuhopecten yessoensis TaxID=6573 RepID=A0A210R250_MIZYE|nr:DNA polymerase nu-like [Mizuhopecten yessoensis]OWF55047.1 DNA polymerase nu [Mizuhopecten yessoensis]
MSPVWRPVSAPPQLDRFCHLSDDAQLVMKGIYRQYNEQRKQQNTQEQPGTYYQQMYERRFGALPGVIFSSSQTRQTASILPGPSSSTLEPGDVYINSLSNQLERTVCGKSNAHSVRVNNSGPIPESSHSSTMLVSESSKNSALTDISMEQPDAALPNTNFEDTDTDILFQQDKGDSWRYEKTTFEGSPLLGNNEKCHSICSTNTLEKEAVYASDFKIPSDNMRGIASPGNSPNCTTDTRQSRQSMVTNTCTGPAQGKSSISARLKQHMIIRKDIQMKQDKREHHKRQSGVPINASEGSTTSCLDTDRKYSSAHFSTPYKKQKKIMDDQTSETHKVLAVSRQHTAREVTRLSDQDLRNVLQTLLSAQEVLITLVYKNGSTQLRDINAAQTKKKSTGIFRQKQWTSEVQSVAVCGCEGGNGPPHGAKVWLFPLPGQDHNKDSRDTHIRVFWKDLVSNQHRKICCDAKIFLIILMKEFNVHFIIDVAVFDPVVAAWLMDPDCENVTFHKSLSLVCLTWKEHVLSSAVDVLREDMCLLSELMKCLYQKLVARDLWVLYCCVEMKLLPLLAAMELRPLRVDSDTMLRFSDVLKQFVKFESSIPSNAGHPFLINSPAQLRQVLFEELKLDKKLPGGKRLAKTNIGHQISTSEAVLSQLVGTHCLPAIILEYRQVQKLKSTYVEGMMSCVREGYISTHWDQTSAATGRLSSYQPNIQAIPKTSTVISDYTNNYIVGKKSGDRVEIFPRDSFISHDGWSFLAADFQQIELRLLAHLADDPTLLKIFTESRSTDIFIELTSQWLSKPVSLVTTQEREQTKRVVYSVMYGAGKERLAEYLKMSTHDAKAIIDSFLVKFPAVSQFSRKCVEFCQRNGFTTTIFKRRRLIPNIKSPSPVLRAQAERQAVNFCVQGSAADLCKAAMIQVEHTLQSHAHLKARLVVQIHDELLLEVSDEDLNSIRSLVQSVMEDEVTLCGKMVTLKVPIKVSLSSGKTWGHLSPLDSGKL